MAVFFTNSGTEGSHCSFASMDRPPLGLFRHYWVLMKFVITVFAAIILFIYTQTLEQLGIMAQDSTLTIDDLRNGSPVLHSGLAVLALLVNTTLSVDKPREA